MAKNHDIHGDRDFLPALVMIRFCSICIGWLGSLVVSVLDSGTEGPGFKSQSQSCHSLGNCSHQAAKLVAAVLRVAEVTAGLAESNGRVYDSRHLQADCQEPGSAPEPYAR